MITIYLTYDKAGSRHYLNASTDDHGQIADTSRNGMPRDHWDAGRSLIRLALAEGAKLENRGDRYEQGGYAVVVERVMP